MSVSSVITLGYGQGVGFIPTLGYLSSNEPIPAPGPAPRPVGGWAFRRRKWSAEDDEGNAHYFNTAEEALDFAESIKDGRRRENAPKQARRIGKAPISYKDIPVSNYTVKGVAGDAEQVLRDARMRRILQDAVNRSIQRRAHEMQREEEEMLLLIAAMI